jgi:antitoxin MazE
VKVAKWGNSLAVRLPKETAEALGVSEGDDIAFEHTPEGDVKVRKQLSIGERIDQLLEKYPARLPADFKFDRQEANRRGE